MFSSELWFLAYALLWGVAVFYAVRIVHDGRTSQGTLGWVMVLMLVPALALPAYFVLGERRLHGYVRARRGGRRRLDDLYRATLRELAPSADPTDDPHLAALATLAGVPWTRGNAITLMEHADEMYDALVEALDSARDHVHIQFYIYRDDESGRRIRDALARAASRGVDTAVMYDEVGCISLPSDFFSPVRDAGGKVSGFRMAHRLQRGLNLNFRNHRKLVVVDGRICFLGGMNIADEYRGVVEAVGLWRDTHIMAVGPCALEARLVFAEDWSWATRSLPAGADRFPPGETPPAPPPPSSGLRPVRDMLVLASGPSDEREAGVLIALALINRARRRLWLATPYFVCEESVMQAIVLARLRRVDVRIIVPETPDSRWVNLAAKSFIRDATTAGAEVFLYTRGFMHHKVMICDDLVSIGSANLDRRSMLLNFELTGLVDDPDFCRRTEAMYERDLRSCTPVPKDHWEAMTSTQRFLARFARLASPVL